MNSRLWILKLKKMGKGGSGACIARLVMLVFAFCILGAFYGIVASPFKNKAASSGK